MVSILLVYLNFPLPALHHTIVSNFLLFKFSTPALHQTMTTRKRNEHGNKHRPEIEKTKELGKSFLEDLGRSEPKKQNQAEKGAKHAK